MNRYILTTAVFLTTFIVKSETIQDAINAYENDKLNKATAILSALVKANPNDAEALYYLGSTYIEKEKFDSAKIYFNKAAANVNSPFGYVGLGKMLLTEKKYKEAKVQFDKALLITKEKDAKILNVISQAYSAAAPTDAKRGIELATKAVALDKKNPDSYISLGDAYLLEENNGGMALTNYENAIAFNPRMAKAYLRIGQLYNRSRNYSAALENFNKALEIDPNYAAAYRDLGELHNRAKKYDKAKETYKKYLEISESNTATLTRYAYMLFLAKEYSEATNVINQISAQDSSNIILKRLLAYSYYEQNKPKDGLSSMEYFMKKIEPSRIINSDYEYYGKLLYKNGKDSLGVINLNKALEMDTSKYELYSDLGDAYIHWRKYPQAQEAFNKKIAKAQKGTLLDYFGLGKAYYYNKQYVEADSAFSKIIQLRPTASAGYLWRARSNNVNPEKDLERVKPFYEKYLEIAVPDPKASKKEIAEAYNFMGYYQIQKDDNAKAKEYYLKALEVDPENKQAKDVLKQLK